MPSKKKKPAPDKSKRFVEISAEESQHALQELQEAGLKLVRVYIQQGFWVRGTPEELKDLGGGSYLVLKGFSIWSDTDGIAVNTPQLVQTIKKFSILEEAVHFVINEYREMGLLPDEIDPTVDEKQN